LRASVDGARRATDLGGEKQTRKSDVVVVVVVVVAERGMSADEDSFIFSLIARVLFY
jgi:hypothetical protein